MSNLKIFTNDIDGKALDQIYTLVKQPAFADCKIRIMPDVHAGAGCVIGFTADLGDKVIPNLVGVDIGCGMRTVKLKDRDIDFEKLDNAIRQNIPSGRNICETASKYKVLADIENDMIAYSNLKNFNRVERSIGTLGGGNHFIEIDKDDEGNYYLVIHTGSRNLGKQVAEHYQKMAIEEIACGSKMLREAKQNLISKYRANGKEKEISEALKELSKNFDANPLGIPKELCYLEGKSRDAYLHDMKMCQDYAVVNRKTISEKIISAMDFTVDDQFETIHNYIDHDSNIIRKGAISAKRDEPLLIPINMRDGCILGAGKGNSDWNCSAPHGAGRLMSRSQAKEKVSLEEYAKSMEGIFSTSVCKATIDESPMAYKPMDEIVSNIADTVEIKKILKPVYNFKAAE